MVVQLNVRTGRTRTGRASERERGETLYLHELRWPRLIMDFLFYRCVCVLRRAAGSVAGAIGYSIRCSRRTREGDKYRSGHDWVCARLGTHSDWGSVLGGFAVKAHGGILEVGRARQARTARSPPKGHAGASGSH